MPNSDANKFTRTDILIVVLFALIAITSIWQYRYGYSDHAIVVPFVKNTVDCNLYRNDYLIAEKANLRTGLWTASTWVIKHLKVKIEHLFFFYYVVSVSLLLMSLYLIALTIFIKREVAVLSLVFFLLLPIPTLGGVQIVDFQFLTRTAATPLLLFAMYFFLKKKYFISVFFQGVGFLIHPLSAVYMIAMLSISLLFRIRDVGLKKFFLYVLVLAVTISPLLLQKISGPLPVFDLFHADTEWLSLLRLRSAHHIFPFSWGIAPFLNEGLLLLAFAVSWQRQPAQDCHRVILSSTAAILLLFICGTVFTELVPVPIVIQFQLFRSSVFLAFLAVIYLANFFITELQSEKKIVNKIFILILSSLFFFDKTSIALLLFLGCLMVFYRAILKKEIFRAKGFVLLLVMFTVVTAGMKYRKKDGGFSLNDAQNKEWLAVQEWAKKNTESSALFIVPPNWQGFRIESERSIYGDWKDGTMMFFNPAFGKKWFARMCALGYREKQSLDSGFKHLTEHDFTAIAQKETDARCKVFLVMFAKNRSFQFPLLYRNRLFLVYAVEKTSE